MKKIFFSIATLFMLTGTSIGQNTFPSSGAVGIGTTSPNSTALLEVKSTTKGVLLPRMTGAQRIAIPSPANGLLVYQTDGSAGLWFYNVSAWQQVSPYWASSTLSNLKPITAVNVSLLPGTTASINLGSSSKMWLNGYFSGNVGAGSVSAGSSGVTIGVSGTGSSYGVSGNSSGGYGVYGNSGYLGVYGVGGTYGLYGVSTGGGYGVLGTSSLTGVYGSGGTYGVYGSGGTYGVYASGTSDGVYGTSSSGYGVQGNSGYLGVYGVGTTYGVFGFSSGNYGVYGSSGYMGTYGTGTTYGVYGYSSGGWGTSGISSSNYGVYGSSSSNIAGYFTSSSSHGIWAKTGSSASNVYAGVFEGNVYTYGTYNSSDRRLKKNIQEISGAMATINKLKPRNYEFRSDDKFASLQLPKGVHYGLIAQDLEEVLPDLVREAPIVMNSQTQQEIIKPSQDGKPGAIATQKQTSQSPAKEIMNIKAINYVELIPIIIKGMQELSAQKDQQISDQQNQIIDLQNQINELRALIGKGDKNSPVTFSGYLKQNVPNPSNNNTIIKYNVPENMAGARIIITDAKGSTLKVFNTTRGEGQISINSGVLPAGTYNYTLYHNDKVIDSKQMVIVK